MRAIRAFGARGGWWVAAQSVLMAAIAIAWLAAGASWGGLVTSIGVVVALVGVAFGLGGLGYLGRNLTPFPTPRPGTTLVDRGPYRIVRHPIYGGIVLAALGMSVADANPAGIALSVLLAVLFSVKAAVEERHLRASVDGYAGYCDRVRWRILPFVP